MEDSYFLNLSLDSKLSRYFHFRKSICYLSNLFFTNCALNNTKSLFQTKPFLGRNQPFRKQEAFLLEKLVLLDQIPFSISDRVDKKCIQRLSFPLLCPYFLIKVQTLRLICELNPVVEMTFKHNCSNFLSLDFLVFRNICIIPQNPKHLPFCFGILILLEEFE